jgi:hypothetical protein
MTSKNTKTKFAIDIRRESKGLAHDKAARWLSGHKDDTPLVNAKAERKQRRRELYQQHLALAVTPGRLFRRLRRCRPLRLRCERSGRVLR